jgi:hypothetical protein
VRQIAQPGGPIDGRPDVVAFVAQLDLAGVQANAQPDRRQRCPLQVQRARNRIAGAGECDHEAVALALFYRPYPVVRADDLRQRAIHAGDRDGHVVRLCFPQLRRALDVGEKQRHHPGWQKLTHAHVAPLGLAHASQHANVGLVEHQ